MRPLNLSKQDRDIVRHYMNKIAGHVARRKRDEPPENATKEEIRANTKKYSAERRALAAEILDVFNIEYLLF